MENTDTETTDKSQNSKKDTGATYNGKKSVNPDNDVQSNTNNQSRKRRNDSDDETDGAAGNDEATKSLMERNCHRKDDNSAGSQDGEGGVVTDNDLAMEKVCASSSIRSIGSIVCRICHNAENPERLISPCICRGTLMFVHINCLEHWLSTSGMVRCELCQFEFQTEHTLRYTCLQSLRIWYAHPNNRGNLQADFLICSLLSIVTFGLVGISLMGLQYYVGQGTAMGISHAWTQGSLVFFLTIIIFVYGLNLYMVIKSQVVPWYRWWQSAKEIKLILENRSPVRFRKKASPMVTEEIQLRTAGYSNLTPDRVESGNQFQIENNVITTVNLENQETRENGLNAVIAE